MNGRRTPLQAWTRVLFELLEGARRELDAQTWEAFISIACDRIGHEAARLVVADAMRALEDEAA